MKIGKLKLKINFINSNFVLCYLCKNTAAYLLLLAENYNISDSLKSYTLIQSFFHSMIDLEFPLCSTFLIEKGKSIKMSDDTRY